MKKSFINLNNQRLPWQQQHLFRGKVQRSDEKYKKTIKVPSSINYAFRNIHAFLECSVPILLNDLRETIVASFSETGLDVQACPSKKSCLIYVSKEDVHLFTNVKVSDLNFNYQVYCRARATTVFNFTDPFFVKHRFCHRYLKKYFRDYNKTFVVPFSQFRQCEMAYEIGYMKLLYGGI